MYTLKIKVTREILEQSKYCGFSAHSCALSVALRDVLPKAHVYYDEIFPFGYTTNETHAFLTPHDINVFITKFDNSGPDARAELPEQEFELPIPDWVIEQINIDEIKPLLQNHHCLTLINS